MSKSKVSLHARRPTMLYTDSGDTTALSLGDDRFLAEVWGSEETADKVREWCAVYDIQYGLVDGEHGRRSIIPDVTVRFLTVDDADKIRKLHERLSEHDEYMRFLTPSPRHLDSLVAMLCRHDSTHAAIGAFHGDDLVGVANYVVTGTTPSGLTDAEFALVVAGDERGQGVGTTLVRRLAIIAYERGVRHLSTEILAENTGMLEVLRNRGWSHALHPDGLCVHVDLDLYPGLELEAAVGPNAASE
ncbi:MAG: GNAT family N-acetyltransferase [Rhodococcus sp. (in: high G+C Gram-positive bacteria)]|uniref:GNAT family N-acetyltransferase n=1 Tax=Rhodococcus sp. TaxID=1831 RepID=UPI003BAF3D70